VELLLVGHRALVISDVMIAAYGHSGCGGGSSRKVVGTSIETILKKQHFRAVNMWVGWSERPVSFVSVGMSLCLQPKHHFAAI
jgi:hypothetical protein